MEGIIDNLKQAKIGIESLEVTPNSSDGRAKQNMLLILTGLIEIVNWWQISEDSY